jgi:L-seryl-tRNA(Ser) seleniumtransferase
MPNPFRNLPSVNQLLESEPLQRLVKSINHRVVVDGVRQFLDDLRTQVSHAAEDAHIPTPQEIAERVAAWLETEQRPKLRPVINGTGILLHTGLGRAPLAQQALDEIQKLGGGYASVEIDLSTGQRGHRVQAVERLLCQITGAEAAAVTNNNAAATMITLSALAAGREVIVSRGQLIEIGGSYRLPDVMQCSGALLKEVGTTNKTRPDDYRRAINQQTAALLRVHPSNFKVVGFSESVSIREMIRIAHQNGLPAIDDVGSGALMDFAEFGLADEPVVRQSVEAGADLVLFSGDKLLGGPQCGIIVGRRKYIDSIVKNPMMRAVRVGKLTLAALQATLVLYLDPEKAKIQIPILRMLSMPIENLRLRADRIVAQIGHLSITEVTEVVQQDSMLGGGSLPTQNLPTWCVSILPKNKNVERFAKQLRDASPSVVGRVQQDRFLLDLRTIHPGQDAELVQILEKLDA